MSQWDEIKQRQGRGDVEYAAAIAKAVTKASYTPTDLADAPVPLVVDRATGRLLVDSNAGGGGGAGTEYTEGDSDASVTGGAMIAFTSGNAAVAALAESDGTLIVNPTALSNSTDSITAHQGGTWTVGLSAGTNGIGKLTSNDGVDIGDVTINNASGASAVNIQDGGNSITVDGTVTVQDGGSSVSVDDNGSTLSIDDGAGSITVDGSVTAVTNLASTVATGNDLVCATAGTAVQGANVAVTNEITIIAYPTNTGNVYIGASDVTNSSGSKRGVILLPAGMVKLSVSNLNKVYINADTNGDGAGVFVT